MLPKQLPLVITQAITHGKDTITSAVALGIDNYQPATVAVDADISVSAFEMHFLCIQDLA
jgi:hypothetical protein